MNKMLVFIVTLTALFFTLHSGRTDGNGGHYDHSSGEYHYHHGYPAHDHYDMDGDGVIDCPYKTKDNSGVTDKGCNAKDTILNIVFVLALGLPIYFIYQEKKKK